MQSEANSYSTAIESHDFMLWLTCCMKLKCIVGHQKRPYFVLLPGSAIAFLVVLHLPAALELRRAGSGLHPEACSCYDQLASLLKATLGNHVATIILQ